MVQRSLFDIVPASRATAAPAPSDFARGTLFIQESTGLRPATPQEIIDAARHVVDQRMVQGIALNHPEQVKAYFSTKLGGMRRELLGVAYLNNQLNLLAYEEPFGGSLAECPVYPRELVKRALELNAAALIIGHPHPSGLAKPSQADIDITRRVAEALKTVDVRLVDHIIVAGGQAVSLASQGLM